MTSLSDADVLDFARRTLRYPPNASVPNHYVAQLKEHLRSYPYDTQFVVYLQPSTGYGKIVCNEKGCNGISLNLSRSLTAPSGGKAVGFGSFRAYQSHIETHPTHAVQRHSRVQNQINQSTLFPATSIPLNPHLLNPVAHTPVHSQGLPTSSSAVPSSVPKKRLSGDLVDLGQPQKKVKAEVATPAPAPPLSTQMGHLLSQPAQPKSSATFRPYVDSNDADKDSIQPYHADNDYAFGPNQVTKVKQEDRKPHIPLMPIINAPMNPQATPIVSPESELQRLRERVAIYERELQSFYNSPSSSNPSFSKAQSDLQIAIIRTKRQIAEQERRLNNPHSGAFKQEVKPEPKEEWPPFPLAQQHVPRVAPSPRGPQTAVHHTHNYNYEESESESDHEDFRAGDPFGAVINMLGTIGDFRPSPSPTSAGRRGDDFNAFLIAAGNAETFEQDATIHDALKTLGMKHLDPAIPFKNMTVSLLPHQCIGVAWMTEQEKGRNQGGILADEMGLGKTIQILATCCFNRSRDPACKTTLVIVPVALLRQWKEEIEDKTKDGTALIYHGSSKNSIKSVKDFSKYDYVLTTFGTLGVEWPGNEVLKKTKKARKRKRDDFIEDDAEESDAPKKSKKKTNDGLLFQMYWYRVVLDEAQNVRNKGTRNSMAVTDLRAVYRWALTGTPLVNSTSDAYGLLRFLKIRPWYDWTDFRTEIQSLEKTNPKLATSRLQSIFKTCLLRRNKDSQLQGKRLIELPPKHHHLENLAFSPPEQAIYEMLQRRSRGIFNQYLRRGTVLKNYAHIFVLLLRLRQCAVHPALIGQFEDAFISEGEVRPTGEMEDPTAERERAAGIMGKVWVQAVRERYKMLAEERITLEKKDVNATIQIECPICLEPMISPQITPCLHAFCPECIVRVLNSPLVQEGDDQRRYAQHERPCPACRAPFSEERIFHQSAFEPTDAELGIQDAFDDLPPEPSPSMLRKLQKAEEEESSSDEEIVSPAKGKGKGKAVAKHKSKLGGRRSSRSNRKTIYAEGYEDSDDSLSDFIIQDDESETEKDRKRDVKKKLEKLKNTGRRSSRRIDSDDDDYVGTASEAEEEVGEVEGEEESEALSDEFLRKKPRRKRVCQKPPNLSQFLPSTKMKTMMELLKQWRDQYPEDKTIIVSQWTSVLNLVEFYLHEQGFNFELYTGEMNANDRHQAVHTFMHNDDVTVMLMSLTAGGVGLNLTRANRVISLDFAWSEAIEAQAFDRTHRLGQRKEVEIYRLAIQNTVEAKVMALQEKKKHLADGSLGEGTGRKLGKLSVRELANLFGLDARGQIIE